MQRQRGALSSHARERKRNTKAAGRVKLARVRAHQKAGNGASHARERERATADVTQDAHARVRAKESWLARVRALYFNCEQWLARVRAILVTRKPAAPWRSHACEHFNIDAQDRTHACERLGNIFL